MLKPRMAGAGRCGSAPPDLHGWEGGQPVGGDCVRIMEGPDRALAFPQFVWRYRGKSGTSRDGSGTPIIVTFRALRQPL
jgi:hypothetical protein